MKENNIYKYITGATLRAPIAGCSQMLGSIGTIVNPDVHADVEVEPVLALEAGSEARPTQPPHPSLIVDVPSGYPEDLETFSTPDTVDVTDIFSVDVMPLATISTSGMQDARYLMSRHVCCHVYVCRPWYIYVCRSILTIVREKSKNSSMSVDDLGTYPRIRNFSLALNVGPTSLGDTASGGFPLNGVRQVH